MSRRGRGWAIGGRGGAEIKKVSLSFMKNQRTETKDSRQGFSSLHNISFMDTFS